MGCSCRTDPFTWLPWSTALPGLMALVLAFAMALLFGSRNPSVGRVFLALAFRFTSFAVRVPLSLSTSASEVPSVGRWTPSATLTLRKLGKLGKFGAAAFSAATAVSSYCRVDPRRANEPTMTADLITQNQIASAALRAEPTFIHGIVTATVLALLSLQPFRGTFD